MVKEGSSFYLSGHTSVSEVCVISKLTSSSLAEKLTPRVT
jgi:hypothetical protein